MRNGFALLSLIFAPLLNAETRVDPSAGIPDWFAAPVTMPLLTTPTGLPEPLPAASPGFLDELRASFVLDHHLDDRRVAAEIRWLRKHPSYLRNIAPRMQRFLPYICKEVRRRGMPGELCLLPIVESALDPFAFSPGGAAGLWQFIPGTGKRYGLKIDWWVDERRDPILATDAALRYLGDLNARFDDWLLAVASYNWGEGRVARAKRKAGPDATFFELRVPRETAGYVPRLLAFAAVMADPAAHGIELFGAVGGNEVIEVGFAEIDTHSQLDVAKASEALSISVDDIYRLNPALNQWATHPRGPHRILVPRADADHLQNALNDVPAEQRVRWTRHRIGANETLGHLARRYHTDVATLKRVNGISGTMIRQGDHVLIPKASLDGSEYPTPVRRREQGRSVYVVKSGDSLWEISQRTGVSVNKLMRANHVGPKDVLKVGQRLAVPGGTARGDVVRSVKYRVRNGDSLAKIAGKFNVSVSDIAGWNELDPKGYIHPGQRLKLYVNVTAPSG